MTVLILHAGATLLMTGLIWFVQIVHYPLFAGVGREALPAYERAHQRRTTWVVGPLMLLEAATVALLVFELRGTSAAPLTWTGAVLLLVIWLSTAFVQVPCHRRLEAGFDETAIRRLVAWNWLRTLAWSARSVIALILLLPSSDAS